MNIVSSWLRLRARSKVIVRIVKFMFALNKAMNETFLAAGSEKCFWHALKASKRPKSIRGDKRLIFQVLRNMSHCRKDTVYRKTSFLFRICSRNFIYPHPISLPRHITDKLFIEKSSLLTLAEFQSFRRRPNADVTIKPITHINTTAAGMIDGLGWPVGYGAQHVTGSIIA